MASNRHKFKWLLEQILCQQSSLEAVETTAERIIAGLVDAGVVMLVPVPAKCLAEKQAFTREGEWPYFSGRWDVSFGINGPIDSNMRVLEPESTGLDPGSWTR